MNSLRTLLLSLMAGTIFLSVPVVQAQGGISISPLISELEVVPGQSYEKVIQVTNKDVVPLEISIEPFDIEIQSETHGVTFLPESSRRNIPRSLAAWVDESKPASFVLEPGEQQPIELEIKVPDEANSGDYFASLNVYYRSTLASTQANILVKQSIGSLLLVSIASPGEIKAAAPTDYMAVGPTLGIGRELVSLTTELKNNTLRYIRVKPLVTVLDDKDTILYQREAPPKRVFPGENAEFAQDFPSKYLTLKEPLRSVILLASVDGAEQYFETTVDLTEYQADYEVGKFPFDPVKVFLSAGAVIILIILLAGLIWRRRAKK
jgi:hypothetical protein